MTDSENVAYSAVDKLLLDGAAIHVMDPQREGEGRDSFVSYRIKIENHQVRRRYNDFDSFHDAMIRLNPTCIVPPLPEKQSFTVAQMSMTTSKFLPLDSATRATDDVDIIEARRRLLESFLRRTSRHPILGASQLFHKFLEAENWPEILVQQSIPANVSKFSKALTSITGKVSQPDPKFLDIQNHAFKFGQQAAAVDRSARRLVRRQTDLAADFSELSNSFHMLSKGERELQDMIKKTGDAVDGSFLSLRFMTGETDEILLDPLHEYSLFMNSVRNVLSHQELELIAVENARNTVATEKEKMSNLQKIGTDGTFYGSVARIFDTNPKKTLEENLRNQKVVIEQAETALEESRTNYSKVAESVLFEWTRFNQEKDTDFSTMMRKYVQTQIDFCKRNAETWQRVVVKAEEMEAEAAK